MHEHITSQARRVLDVLSACRCHLTADDILSALPGASIATVYRALDSLTESGHICKLSINGKKAVYEFIRTPHLHFVCTRCGCIHDIDVDITAMVRAAAQCEGHAVSRVDTTAYGLCQQCQSNFNEIEGGK